MAAKLLARTGHSIWDRNWRCPYGELDIVAERDRSLVFIEVKSRRSERYDPEDAIDYKKEHRLKLLAKIYKHKHSLKIKRARIKYYRFDSVSVTFGIASSPKVVHKEDIFEYE